MSTVVRTSLSVREAGFLLQRSEMVVRRMIDAGVLQIVGSGRDAADRRKVRIDPESARQRFPRDGSYQLRMLAMRAILADRLKIPAPATRWGAPAQLTGITPALMAVSAAQRFASLQQQKQQRV